MFIYGVLLLIVIVAMPGGISGVVRDTVKSIKEKKAAKELKGDDKKVC